MIPVSRLARALGVEYVWDADTQTATFMPGEASELPEPPVEAFVFDEAGTFGPATGSVTIRNDVLILVEDVILQNYIITGDLIIAEEVGEGNVTLNNVTVQGTTYVRGGGMESIYINGGAYNEIIIEKVGGNVRIVVVNAEGIEIVITEDAAEGEVILDGLFDKVTILSSDITVHLVNDTTVNELIVTEDLTNVRIVTDEETVINLLTANTRNVSIEGEGTVKKTAGENVNTIKYGEDITRPVPSFGGGGGGGGGGGSIQPSTSAIDTAITAANAAKVGVEISADGTDVAPGTFWVTQEVNNTLNVAIATATAAKATVKTEQEVTDAVAALDAAGSSIQYSQSRRNLDIGHISLRYSNYSR
jgi:hypothetical protein